MRSGSCSAVSILPGPTTARSNERFGEHDATAPGAGIVVHVFPLPSKSNVEPDGTLVSVGGDRLHLNAVGSPAALGEPFIKQSAHSPAAEVRMNPDEVDVPGAG